MHAEPFFSATQPHPEIYTYLPFGPFPTVAEFLDEVVEGRVHRNPALVLFAVIDKKTGDGKLAGIIGLLNTSTANLSTEIGFVFTLPAFQRTHITSNAIGLLLYYCLDLPSSRGLGLRRVQWQCNSVNESSIRAAERMGFKAEATLRWDRALPLGKGKVGNGRAVIGRNVDGTNEEGLGRDTRLLSLCWDDWQGGGREKARAVIDRR